MDAQNTSPRRGGWFLAGLTAGALAALLWQAYGVLLTGAAHG